MKKIDWESGMGVAGILVAFILCFVLVVWVVLPQDAFLRTSGWSFVANATAGATLTNDYAGIFADSLGYMEAGVAVLLVSLIVAAFMRTQKREMSTYETNR